MRFRNERFNLAERQLAQRPAALATATNYEKYKFNVLRLLAPFTPRQIVDRIISCKRRKVSSEASL